MVKERMIVRPLDLLLRYVDEDSPFGDATSESIIPDIRCLAVIKAEREGIVAGLDEAGMLFSYYGTEVEFTAHDGDRVRPGDLLLELAGRARAILLVERTALNIIGRMSGIATRTSKIAAMVASVNPGCRIAATRKTSPGFRLFDKKAVVIGGGDPHRSSLSDGILIKDNHLALVSLEDAVRAAKNSTKYKIIEVEAESPADARRAVRAGAHIVMLDNMSVDEIRSTLAILEEEGLRKKCTIEISGGIDERTILDFAALDVDVISLGSLTHTVTNFSVNLEIRQI